MTTKPGDIAAAAIAFMESQPIEWEDAAALGDTDASGDSWADKGAPAETPPRAPNPGLFTQSPAWTRRITRGRIGGANDNQPKTRKAPAAKRAASKTGAKRAAIGIRDPVFALIDAIRHGPRNGAASITSST